MYVYMYMHSSGVQWVAGPQHWEQSLSLEEAGARSLPGGLATLGHHWKSRVLSLGM